MTQEAKLALRGLQIYGHQHVSATEIGSCLNELKSLRYVETWNTMGGFMAWRATPLGLEQDTTP
jgi:hypothetical protein